MIKRISIVVLAVALLGGCSGLTRQQQRALSGGAIGAAGGAIIGALTGGVVTGAVIGAAGGAAVGALTK
ncbi:MAG TPA: YMGG-like glycine zipper-containing protein [Stellaceae bacterium]|nr:YMGG-like glycine zipper-containing protein [Stellaceae bacterium]